MTAILRIDSQAETSEILVKGEGGRVIKQMDYHNIGKGVAKGQPLVFRELPEDLFGRPSDRVLVPNYVERRFHLVQKCDREIIAGTIPEEGYGFTDDVPGGVKRNVIPVAEFEEVAGPFIIGVFWAQRGEKERGVTKGPVLGEVQ